MFLICQEPVDLNDDDYVYLDEKNTIQSFAGLNGTISNLENVNRYVLTVEDGIDLILTEFASKEEYIYFIYDSNKEDSIKGKIRKILDDREKENSGWEKLNNQGLWVKVLHTDDESLEINLSVEYSLVFSTQNKLNNDEILKFLNDVGLNNSIPSINYLNSVNKMGFIAHTTWWDHFDGIKDNYLHVLIMYTLNKLLKKETCPCCGYKTLRERNNWETCPICKWMDDDLQSIKPDLKGGANKESLREAQKNYKEIGRVSKTFFHLESEPTSNYEKDKNWKPLAES